MATMRARWLWLLASAGALAGCGAGTTQDARPPVAIGAEDACAVCGMDIAGSPGPRAEAYVGDAAQPLKFESTRDFFAYVLQPDVTSQLGAVYVQDAARIDWTHPGGAAAGFTDARAAYYVAWQPLQGGMGPTLASFAHRADADAFVAAHGGEVLRFGDVTPALVSQLDYACPAPGTPAARLVRACRAAPPGAVAQEDQQQRPPPPR